jgi:hypothetical protein
MFDGHERVRKGKAFLRKHAVRRTDELLGRGVPLQEKERDVSKARFLPEREKCDRSKALA